MYFTMQKIEKTALQNTFFLAHSQNINAIPVNQDKKPACKSWGQWQTQPQTLEESQKHSNGSSAGIAVITGTASGGLESIDFDQMEVYQEYLDAAHGTPMEAIINRIREGYEEQSPKGIHWLYKISNAGEPFPANEEWSYRGVGPNKKGVMGPKIAIETRGQGGYIVTAPSLNGKYKLLSGSLDKIVTITMEERKQLKALAKQLDDKQDDDIYGKQINLDDAKPIDEWKQNKTWDEILTPDGFTKVSTKGNVTKWHNEGSENDVSAVSGIGGKSKSDTFICFSSNKPSWMPKDKTLSKFDYIMLRDYQGDFKKAFLGVLENLGRPVKNLALGKKNQASTTTKTEAPEVDKPSLLITVDESQVTKDALEILKEDQFLYIKQGRIVSPMIQGKNPRGKNRTKLEGKLSIIGVETAFIRARLMDQARLYKEVFSKKGEVTEEPARCPEWLPSAISATAINGEMNPIRNIEGILAGPVIDEDGNLINNDGYSLINDNGWYQAGRVDGLKLNADLSQKGCSDAAHRLTHLLVDFQFQDDELDPAKWLTCLLSQLCRPIYQNCPMFIFSANVGGAGKTHLAKSVGLICHGTECVDPEWPEAKEKREDEMGKMNAGYAFAGVTLVNYDNVPDGLILASSVLEKQLTSSNIYHRENHKHTEIGGKNWIQWMLTGNNVRPHGFLAIRSIIVTLQSTSANPSSLDPTCFTHGDFLQHIKKNRVTILQDALSIIAGYIRAGKPEQKGKHLARFEEWLKIPCSAVRWATGLDPLSDHQRTVADFDPTIQALEMLAQGWMEAFPMGSVKASAIFNLVTGGIQGRLSTIPDAITEDIKEAITQLVRVPLKNVNQIGPALQRFKGRIIEVDGEKHRLDITKDPHTKALLFGFHKV
jgi:hypothetical protein